MPKLSQSLGILSRTAWLSPLPQDGDDPVTFFRSVGYLKADEDIEW
jgi:hypothetical protein